MSEKRRALGRGLGALIPTATGSARPVDVFFRERDDDPGTPPPSDREERVAAGDHHDHNEHRGPDEATGSTDPSGPAADADHDRDADGVDRRDVSDGDGASGIGEGTPSPAPATAYPAADGLAPVPGAVFAELPIAAIRPNPKQPRTVFDEDELAELAASIAEIGVLQPVVVRRVAESPGAGDGSADASGPTEPRFELIMGERRLRASERAGLETIPAIIKDTQDDALLRDALLENLHRSQLNPLEEAAAYQQLLDDFGCSHEELATRIGRSRPQISNTLRLLRLPPLVARRLAAGVLSAGHARALLALDDGAAMERLAQRIVAEGLSVRSVEEIVALGGDAAPRTRRPRAGARHPQLDDLAAQLSDRFDTRVSIALGQRKGKLTVEFGSVEDLNRIVALLGHPAAG